MNALPVLREMIDSVGASLYETIRRPTSNAPDTHYNRLARMDGRTLNGFNDTLDVSSAVALTHIALVSFGAPPEILPLASQFSSTGPEFMNAGAQGAVVGATGRALWNGTHGLLAGMDIGLRRLLKIHPAAR